MIVCARCLQRNNDDAQFCVSCGTYLEWSSDQPRPVSRPAAKRRTPTARRSPPSDGRRKRPPRSAPAPQRGAEGAPPAETGTAPPEPQPSGVGAVDVPPDLDAESAALYVAAQRLRERTGSRSPPAPAPSRARHGARPAGPPTPPPTTPPPTTPPPALKAEPPREGTPGPEQPRPIDPSARTAKPPRPAPTDDHAPQPGDVECPQCGAGNSPSRYFCRRCGGALQLPRANAEAASPGAHVRRRWWWWLWPFGRHRDDTVPDTPAEPPDWPARAKAAAPVAAVILLIAAILGPCRSEIADRIEAARMRFAPRYVNVHPARVEASTSLPDHPPEAAVDRAPNTYWAEAGPSEGVDEGLIFTFAEPVDLGRIGFYNGAQTKPQDFLAQPRVREVRLVFDTGEYAVITLDDRDAFQHRPLEARQVTQVTMLITSVYPSPLGGTAASLGEVEFFTKE